MAETTRRFAVIGVAGYIAPRHLRAIRDVGGEVVAALDPNDSVGIIDSYFPDADFFTEFERFDRHLEKQRRTGRKVDYVTICSPNYLHDAHVRFALRIGADAICEKPLVLNPWNVEALAELERESGRRIHTILQLRLHPAIQALRDEVAAVPSDAMNDVELTYITARGRWYLFSWKGDEKKSGGVANNIGVHFFDMLTWIFGPVKSNQVHLREATRAGGFLQLERARVRWYLSINRQDLPADPGPEGPATHRSILVNDRQIEFSQGFADLHTESYRQILDGRGFNTATVLPSIQITSDIRNARPLGLRPECHPLAERYLRENPL